MWLKKNPQAWLQNYMGVWLFLGEEQQNSNVRATEFHSVSCIYQHSSTLESATSNP